MTDSDSGVSKCDADIVRLREVYRRETGSWVAILIWLQAESVENQGVIA
jgi:hypothetical protein